jgi:cytochrome c
MRRIFLLLAVVGMGVAGVVGSAGSASGEAPGDRQMKAALERGRALWARSWAPNQKSCAACHTGGANKLVAARVKSYPKWDKQLDRVVTAQQKINQMIVTQAHGQALELGSDDLNALEAFVSTLR